MDQNQDIQDLRREIHDLQIIVGTLMDVIGAVVRRTMVMTPEMEAALAGFDQVKAVYQNRPAPGSSSPAEP